MHIIIYVVLIGLLTGIWSFFPASFLLYSLTGVCKKIIELLSGFVGGLIIAYVCFEMFPKAFNTSGLHIVVIAILAGIILSSCFQKKWDAIFGEMRLDVANKNIKEEISLSNSFYYSTLLESSAIGAFCNIALEEGLKMAGVIIIYYLVKTISTMNFLCKEKKDLKRAIKTSSIFASVVSIGVLVGFLLSLISTLVIAVLLGVSGGIMLHTSCGYVIPSTKSILKRILVTTLSIAGFILGILLVFK